jgi:hypothetical protein
MNAEQLDECSRPLLGRQLASVEKRDHSWFFSFGPGISIATESLWRLINDGRVAATSEDDGEQFGQSERVDARLVLELLLQGRTVTAAAIVPSSGDLAIHFDGGSELQFLQTSSGYESWRLAVGGRQTICVGGGEVVRVAEHAAAPDGTGARSRVPLRSVVS